MEKLEPSYTAGGNVNWCSRFGKQSQFLKKLDIQLPYNSAILVIGIYPRELKNLYPHKHLYRDIIAALFIIAEK